MLTQAAVLWQQGGPWKVEEIELDPPAEREGAWVREFGAHHAVSSIDEAFELVSRLTGNVMADKAIRCVGVAHGADIGPLLSLVLYTSGQLKLDELVTARYPLEAINEGYEAMHRGDNLRGIITYS